MSTYLVRTLVVAITGCVCGLLMASCSKSEPQANVLLITVDTLRPDALGFINGRNDTPAIDALAASGRTFTAAISPVPLTLPSHTSMLSGQLPRHHGVRDNGQIVPGDVPLVQERLQQHGYQTGAFVSGFPLQALFGLDRGFDRYDDEMRDGKEGWVERRAKDTVAAMSTWIGQRDSARPWFGWAHFYDPHEPYEPPREFWQPGVRGAYDGEVLYADYWIGKLIENARLASGTRPLLVILTADHAEALGEHREITHGFFVYDSTMRVPLIFQWAGRIAPAQSDEPVQLIDLAPTILELLGMDALPDVDGRSIAAALEGGAVNLHPALMESWLPWTYYGWAPLTALLEDNWKLIDAPAPELFDLAHDPQEQDNRVEHEQARADRLGIVLQQQTATHSRIASTEINDEATQRLRSLGYVGVGAPVEAPASNLADPKSRIEERDTLQTAEGLLRMHRYAEAQEIFERVLAEDPDNRFATLRSGIALLRLGRLDDAVHILQHAVKIGPQSAEARYVLGDALMRNQAYSEAADQWAALAELQPRRKEAWFNLASALEKMGETERARTATAEYERLQIEQDKLDAAPAAVH